MPPAVFPESVEVSWKWQPGWKMFLNIVIKSYLEGTAAISGESWTPGEKTVYIMTSLLLLL